MKRFLIYACLSVWLLNIFDYMSTNILLLHGGQELNPFVNYIMEKVGVSEGMLFTKIPYLILLTIVTFHAINTKMTKREKILVPSCYMAVILIYSVIMYQYNWKSLMML